MAHDAHYRCRCVSTACRLSIWLHVVDADFAGADLVHARQWSCLSYRGVPCNKCRPGHGNGSQPPQAATVHPRVPQPLPSHHGRLPRQTSEQPSRARGPSACPFNIPAIPFRCCWFGSGRPCILRTHQVCFSSKTRFP